MAIYSRHIPAKERALVPADKWAFLCFGIPAMAMSGLLSAGLSLWVAVPLFAAGWLANRLLVRPWRRRLGERWEAKIRAKIAHYRVRMDPEWWRAKAETEGHSAPPVWLRGQVAEATRWHRALVRHLETGGASPASPPPMGPHPGHRSPPLKYDHRGGVDYSELVRVLLSIDPRVGGGAKPPRAENSD